MKSIFGLMILLTTRLLATDCNGVVSNNAGISLGDTSAILRAVNDMAAKGAEPHVLIESLGAGETLDLKFAEAVKACPEWRSPDGKTKSTLIVFGLAPKARKSGIYFGSAWQHALGDSWNRIKADYMNPRFRDADWTGGLAAGAKQVTKRIEASEDETVHGPTTVNEATDLSGLWSFLMWALAIMAAGGLGIGAVVMVGRRRRENQEAMAAQARAVRQVWKC